MHCLSSFYSVTIPLYVSCLLVSHHHLYPPLGLRVCYGVPLPYTTYKVRVLQNRLQGDAICNTNSVRVMLTVCLPVVAFDTHVSVGVRTHYPSYYTGSLRIEVVNCTVLPCCTVSHAVDFTVQCLNRPLLTVS
jgi:hypothetical protein